MDDDSRSDSVSADRSTDRSTPPLSGDEQTAEQLSRLLFVLSGAPAGESLSLARISKRAGLPMSTLRRLLTALADAGLLTFRLDEATGRGSACLTPAGHNLLAEASDRSDPSDADPST
jgi:DNA-binding IclR family transcriptional regulator